MLRKREWEIQNRRASASVEAGRKAGAALVIALAFVVLLTGLIVAFFSRAMSERQVSNSSANQTKVEFLAEGAADAIIGDFKQEIIAGSTVYQPSPGVSVYTPTASGNMMPGFTGTAANITTYAPNLLKRSAYGQPFYSGTSYNTAQYPSPNRAANVSSQALSLNGRSIPPARWNKGLLLPKANPTSSTDFTPSTSGSNAFAVPDWVLVARNGSNPSAATYSGSLAWSATNASTVVGRYAYAVYHEGGLLDINAVGYPAVTGTSRTAYKQSLAYADLSQLTDVSGTSLLTSTQIDQIVGWRNYATAQPSGTFPNYTFASGSNYNQFIISSTKGFLTVGNQSLWNGQSDRQFSSRQQLISFLTNGIAGYGSLANVQNALQYLGTFSRDLNQPSYVPAVQTNASAPVVLPTNLGGNSAFGGDKLINPGFPNVRVQAAFTRNDDSVANVGDPLVNKRFALNRLAWVSYKGPSALRTQSDADIQALINNGIPWSYLQLGTAVNIQKYFGLTWDSVKNRWNYDLHRGTSGGTRIIMLVGRPSSTAASATIYVEDANRDPDFFELLKAGMTVGSLGKAAVSSATAVNNSSYFATIPPGYFPQQVPANLRYNFDTSVDYHVIQIGANILSEVNPTSYPIRISFDDGTGARPNWEFQGVTDLPYLSYVFNGVLRTKAPISTPPVNYGNYVDSNPFQYPRPITGTPANPVTLTDAGNAYAIQVPAVWNPYDPNGTQSVLRPSNFRVVIDSNDPVSLANGSPNENVWCATEASTLTSGGYGGQGLGTSPGAFSYNATANPTSATGSQISDSVTFTDTTSNGSLFREPTLIFRTSYTGGNASRTAGNITSIDANPLAGGSDPVGTPFAPLVVGSFPLLFQSGSNILAAGTAVIGHGLTTDTGNNRVYFTYRLQYQDPNNASNWITYDTKYARTTQGLFSYQSRGSFSPCVIKGPNNFNPIDWAAAIDPRTARFGMMMDIVNYGRSLMYTAAPPPDNGPTNGWAYDSNGSAAIPQSITHSIRPDFSGGFYFADIDRGDLPPGGPTNGSGTDFLDGVWAQDVPYPSFSAGWTRPLINTKGTHGPCYAYMFAPGMYAQNNPAVPFYLGRYFSDTPTNDPISPSYYADADGVVRRASGAYVPVGTNSSASSPVGLSPAGIQGYPNQPASLVTPATASPFTQSQSRPLLLHRPFRTVAELGYVFRDLPWKNLDFSTPESGDAALLDLFCINETADGNGVVAGKVNLNTHQAPVLAAIVSGAYVDDPKVTDATVGSISPTLSGSVGSVLVMRTTGTMYGPLQNVPELVGKWNAAVAATSGTTYTQVVAGANCGIDLPLKSGTDGYKDGQLSYIGFSGAGSIASGTTGTLADAYAGVSNASLKASISQIQRFREAPIRALTTAGQTRVWNLMIDVTAQTGRYPQSVNSLDKFLVESEQRYWVHVAIDRLTGQVIDKQIEVVKE